MRGRAVAAAAIAAAALAALPATASAALDVNVVMDGGGEGIAAHPTDQRVPPTWTARGEFSVRAYGTSGGYPDDGDRDAVGGGDNFFDGGDTATASGSQIVDLSDVGDRIAGGTVRATLSAWLGGFLTDGDAATVSAEWLDADRNDLGSSILIGPVTPADRGDQTELQQRSASAAVPPGTRGVRVVIAINRQDGAHDDGYADNVSLVLTDTAASQPPPPPPPPSGGGGGVPQIAPINLGPPEVSGDPRVRQTVGCLTGIWTLEPRFTYAWSIDGAPVPGATQHFFTIPATAKGRKLTCTVTGTTDEGSTAATSPPLDVLGKAPSCLPIEGKPVCLRRGRACTATLRDFYRLAGFECRRRGKRRVLVRASEAVLRGRAVVRYGPDGVPSFPTALQAFDKLVDDLPGVKQKPGVVGDAFEGTAALSWMSYYRDRLTPAQKAVVDRFTTPQPVSKAGSSPALVGYRALLPEARQRLASHGLVLKRGITVQAGGGSGRALATSYPAWLERRGENCVITIHPGGVTSFGNPVEARDIISHEMTHCAQAEQIESIGQWNKRPQWVTEGGATWAGGRIALEWTGTIGSIAKAWYASYLQNTAPDLFTRDYEGVGWYQLLEHQGANVWPLLLETQRWGSVYGPYAAYYAGMDKATLAALLWGPTLATNPPLGDTWDLQIPGYPLSRTLAQRTISNGTDFVGAASQRGGLAYALPIRADVVSIGTGGAPIGRFKPPGEDDQPLRSGSYCAKPGGCECPDGGSPQLPEIKRGDAYLGFHGLGPAAVEVRGESLDQWCKRPQDAGINIFQLSQTGHEPLVGTIKAGNCKVANGVFTATARSTNRAYTLNVRIEGFRGFRRNYTLLYGGPDPSFTLEGPQGPYSNLFPVPGRVGGGAIALSRDGKGMGFGFVPTFNADRSAGVAIAGGMRCRR